MESLAAELALATGDGEGREHAVSGRDRGDLVADFLDDPHRLVADRRALVAVAVAAVEPQVRAADRGVGHADDRVGRGLDLGARTLFDADVSGAVENGSAHTVSAARTHKSTASFRVAATRSNGSRLGIRSTNRSR